MKKSISLYFLAFIISLSFFTNAFAQDEKLAEEYFVKKEYDKALVYYQKLISTKDKEILYHQNYIICLAELDKQEDLQKHLKKMARKYASISVFKIQLMQFFQNSGKAKEADKLFDSNKKDIINDQQEFSFAIKYLQNCVYIKNIQDCTDPKMTLKFYEAYRDIKFMPQAYAHEMADLYKETGQMDNMIKEVINYILFSSSNIDVIKNEIQRFFTNEKEFDILEEKLLEKVQFEPDLVIFPNLLIWMYTQKRDYESAFIQSKAYDKRYGTMGSKTYELAEIMINNKEYKEAYPLYEYINSYYPNGSFQKDSRKKVIFCKEEIVKNEYPVDKNAVATLINEYKAYINEYGKNDYTADAMVNLANIYGSYLNKKDTAISLILETLKFRLTNKQRAETKLALADMYLLNDEPWEASLLYSQISLENKEEPVGHLAKLKNAKISYFTGDFLLAKDQLNVLKMATTREIANDAMELSLFIQDYLAEDTNIQALTEYSKLDLLLLQNNIEKLLPEVIKMEKQYSKHFLDVYLIWIKAGIYKKTAQNDSLMYELNLLLKKYPYSLKADDAMYLLAETYDYKLRDKEKAMETYKKIIDTFPQSIFIQESRKRYRQLRGDKISG